MRNKPRKDIVPVTVAKITEFGCVTPRGQSALKWNTGVFWECLFATFVTTQV